MEKVNRAGWFFAWTLGLSAWSPLFYLAVVTGGGMTTFPEELRNPEALLAVATLWLGAVPAALGAWLIWQRSRDWRKGIQWFAVSIVLSFAMVLLIIVLALLNSADLQRLEDAVGGDMTFGILTAVALAAGSLPVWIVLPRSGRRESE